MRGIEDIATMYRYTLFWQTPIKMKKRAHYLGCWQTSGRDCYDERRSDRVQRTVENCPVPIVLAGRFVQLRILHR